jgi:hemolysin activation/secretion protein
VRVNQDLTGFMANSGKTLLVSLPILFGLSELPCHAQVPSPTSPALTSPLTRPQESLKPKPIGNTIPILNTSQLSIPKPKPSNSAIAKDSRTSQNQLSQAAQNEALIPVKKIEVVGSTILTSAEVEALTVPLQNKSVTLSQLRDIADQITQIYQDRNFITSRAILLPQDIKNGIVTIQVREGALERVDVKRAGNVTGRLNDNYIRDRILQAAAPPLSFAQLEDELQLLRADPLIGDIRANLTTGSKDNQSVLQITFTEAQTFSVRPFVDNYGNPSTGIYREGVNLQELNATGNGDSLLLGYTRSGSADVYQVNYQYPINPKNGTLGFNFSASQNPVIEPPFDTLNILTDSFTFELAYRQPIVRTPREEFALGISAAIENSGSFLGGRSFNFQNFKFDDGGSQTRVIRLIQDYVSRDPGGAWALRSSFNAGLDVLGATIRTDGSPDGRFFSWIGQVLRVQRLGSDRDTLAYFRLNMQFSGDQLLSLNRFSIGGPQSIRGYRQNQLTGDSGIQASVELQLPVARDAEGVAIVKLLPFLEAGTIWNNSGINPSPQSLIGLGLGASYQPIRNLTIRIDYGIPLIDAKNPGTNLQDSGLYFSVNGNF